MRYGRIVLYASRIYDLPLILMHFPVLDSGFVVHIYFPKLCTGQLAIRAYMTSAVCNSERYVTSFFSMRFQLRGNISVGYLFLKGGRGGGEF